MCVDSGLFSVVEWRNLPTPCQPFPIYSRLPALVVAQKDPGEYGWP